MCIQNEDDLKELLSQMTLSEKTGQLNQCAPSLAGAFEVSFEELVNMLCDGRISREKFNELMSSAKQDFHEDDLRAGKIGSYNGISDAGLILRLQRIAVEETRLGIPLLFGYDVIHGFRTVTPIPLGESCAWDPELWEATARISAEEATAAGIQMTFAPMVDVSKDARWGRIAESAGEDTLLNAMYGAAKVKGFQTGNLSRPDALAACVKHMSAYGAAEAGRDYNRVELSPQRLLEEYLPPFQACVAAGAAAVMPAFNDLNGVPCSCNRWLLHDILRTQWGFTGMTVSDSNAIAELTGHGVAGTRTDAARLALEAGMDMDMASGCYAENLPFLAEQNLLDMRDLDDAVLHVLRTKLALGLFQDPYQTSEEREKVSMLTPAHRALAYEAACKSMVLLKNNGILPLPPHIRLGITGPFAEDAAEMTGTWALKADAGDCVSIAGACKLKGISCTIFQTAEEALRSDCEVFLAAVGERKTESGEAASKTSLELDATQQALMNALFADGRPVIAVLFNGRPLVLGQIKAQAAAILEAWHPGVEAGNAIMDLLYGKVSPSGKLTASFPAATGQCPIYYDHTSTGRPAGKSRFTSKYLDAPTQPDFPFGYGLSYTTYTYSNIQAGQQADGVAVSVTVENSGHRAGEEIVQCYFRDVIARRVRPMQKLAAFTRIHLEPGEKKEVRFFISCQTLGYYDEQMRFVVENGDFDFMAGGDSQNCLALRLTLKW